ncbi:MAG: phosphoribosylformylglycinamidine cyclo-ligase [Candidatus Cloacimonetes bacterium]|nr:phosphoribosylformylglycinamidine cyclo-ligase [Candidatus Cloacimonadota bacterium]MBL7086959.1 phosphoribosylformylglycinamidine cyclo-ligase [Candidatus Cloacimonadota bacterium]
MKKITYKNSGVNIIAGEKTVQKIKPLIKKTFDKNVLTDIGSFGALYHLDLKKWQNPVLVSSIDGVGTKILLAKLANKFDTIGQDLVNHCVNDILTQGATPLFFLDYIGVGILKSENITEIVKGLAKACQENNVALIGGEMAEMPDVYHNDDFDLAGTIVGCVEKDKIITGKNIKHGDILLGFPSTGLHTNGYSLARKILFEKLNLNIDSQISELNKTVSEAFLTIHKSYLTTLTVFIKEKQIKGLAHITGGGIPGNLKRIIPDGLSAVIDTNLWKIPTIFTFLQKAGNIDIKEMFNVFNMGIGMIAVVDRDNEKQIISKTDAVKIGIIEKGEQKVICSFGAS